MSPGKSTNEIPFNDLPDSEIAGELVYTCHEEPSWWVWVSKEMVHGNTEEKSGIDNENYVVVDEGDVADRVANFMARCILTNSNAKNLTPLELHKALVEALAGMNKVEKMLNIWHTGMMFYTLDTWGLAISTGKRQRMLRK